MKTSELEFTSAASVATIGRALQAACRAVGAEEIGAIESDSGALAQFDDRADIEVFAAGSSLFSGQWGVQVYVVDEGEIRRILLVAMGDSGLARAWGGTSNTASLGLSTKKRDQMAAALRAV